jgi:hypothetical protein
VLQHADAHAREARLLFAATISGGEVGAEAAPLVHPYNPIADFILRPALEQRFIASIDTQLGLRSISLPRFIQSSFCAGVRLVDQ